MTGWTFLGTNQMIPAATATSGTQKSTSACWWTGSIQIAQAEQPSITKASARSGRRRNTRTAARPPAAAQSPHPTRQSSRSIENMETVGPHGLRTVVDNGHWPEHSRNRTTLTPRRGTGTLPGRARFNSTTSWARATAGRVPGPTQGHGRRGDDLRRALPHRNVTETGVEGPQGSWRRLAPEGLDVAGAVACR